MSLLLSGPMMKLPAAGGSPSLTALVEQEISGAAGQQFESAAFTPSGDPLLILIAARSSNDEDVNMDSVTVGTSGRGYGTGTACTNLVEDRNGRSQVYAYWLASPATSSQTLQIDFTANVAVRGVAVYEVANTSGTDATAALGVSGNATSRTMSLTTVSDGSLVVAACVITPGSNLTLSGDQTEEYSLDTTYMDLNVQSVIKATAGTQDVVFTASGSTQHAAVAVEVAA